VAGPNRLKPSRCRTCRKPVEPEGKFFPFCSERCRLVDLGRWLDGSYGIPIAENAPDEPEVEAPDDEPEPRFGKPL
jgi:endogenous inhibitor of DNA gyrase (YacG/DUF329 family)